MERVRVAGRRYSDPDVISLIKATGSLVDPRSSVIHQARNLTAKLKNFDAVPQNALERMTLLASLQGITVEPMEVERRQTERRDAILVPTLSSRAILYNPNRPAGRVAFSIGHEITHTFFPSSIKGSRFRNICESSSKEANELERLCDLGASELLMPLDEFRAAVKGNYCLANVQLLCTEFGSSFEATAFRMATAHPGLAVAGLLRFRNRKDEERRAHKASLQGTLFKQSVSREGQPAPPKYRRQSCYVAEKCNDDFIIRWNKSFDTSSVVYQAALDSEVHQALEALPNESGLIGRLEAVRDPFQREEAHPDFPDVLFFWVAAEE